MGDFKAAVRFHVQFAEFLDSVDVKLIVDSRGFVAAADVVVVSQRLPHNLLSLFAGRVFYQNTCHKVSSRGHFSINLEFAE